MSGREHTWPQQERERIARLIALSFLWSGLLKPEVMAGELRDRSYVIADAIISGDYDHLLGEWDKP